MNSIQPKDIIAWQNEMIKCRDKSGEAYSPVYLKTLHNQLSAIFNHAVKFYGLKDNPAAKVGNMGKAKANAACLDVSGRDQPDQRLHLFRNEETLAWELERVETELWKAPPEPLLEQVSAFLSSAGKDWAGTPTELSALLGVDMKPNALTRRLNVNAGRLLNEYGIRYESSRTRNERTVKLAATERS